MMVIQIYPNQFQINKIYFNKKYLEPLINLKVLQLTIPDKPTSKYQKLKTKEDLIDNLSNMDVIN